MQVSDFNGYLNYKNPKVRENKFNTKAAIIMYHDAAELFYQKNTFQGKEEIFKFYDQLYKSGLKGFKLDISGVREKNNELHIDIDYLSNTIQGKMNLELRKSQDAEWLITKHRFL
jgi:hypothetical protein